MELYKANKETKTDVFKFVFRFSCFSQKFLNFWKLIHIKNSTVNTTTKLTVVNYSKLIKSQNWNVTLYSIHAEPQKCHKIQILLKKTCETKSLKNFMLQKFFALIIVWSNIWNTIILGMKLLSPFEISFNP